MAHKRQRDNAVSVHLGDRPRRVVAGVVDGHIQAAVRGAHLVEERLHFGFSGGIGHDRRGGAAGGPNLLDYLL